MLCKNQACWLLLGVILSGCSGSELAPGMTDAEKRCVEGKMGQFFKSHRNEIDRYVYARDPSMRQKIYDDSRAYRAEILHDCIEVPRSTHTPPPAFEPAIPNKPVQ